MPGQALFGSNLSENALNDLKYEGQGQPSTIPGESYTRCIYSANLVNLGVILHELSSGQALFCENLSKNAPHDLEDEAQCQPLTILSEAYTRCIFGANLVNIG